MSGIGVPRLTIVQPGEGREGFLGTIGVQFKLFGEDQPARESLEAARAWVRSFDNALLGAVVDHRVQRVAANY